MVDQQLALWSRNEDAGVHLKNKRTELLFAGYVLNRLPPYPAAETIQVSFLLRKTDRLKSIDIDLQARQRQHMGQEHLGVGQRFRNPVLLQASRGALQN